MLGAVNLLWLSRNTRLPTWDPFNHLVSGIRYHNLVADLWAGTATLGKTAAASLRVDDHYPPLAPLAVFPAFGLGGGDPRIPTFILNQTAFALLLGATYGLGRRAASEETGVLAAIAVTAFPIVSSQSRVFMLDLPDAAMTALSLLALWRSDRFRRLGPSLLLGATIGLALLTKWTVVFFLAVPLAFELFRASREPDRWRRLRNAAAAIAAASVLALPWYTAHLWNLARDAGKFSYDVGVREGDPPVLSAKSLLFYASSLSSATLLPWTLIFLAGLAVSARERFRQSAILVLSLLAGWAILTSIRNKDSRYLIPMLPAVAVIGSMALDRIRIRFPAKAAVVVAFAAFSMWIAWRRDPPVREHWPVREAVAFLRSQPVARPRLRVVPDWPFFERHAFEYEAEAARFPLDVGMWFHFPAFTDFVVTKSGAQGDRPEPAQIMRDIEDPQSDFASLFKPVWEHPLPDGSVARIFSRSVTPVASGPEEVLRRFKSAAAGLAAVYFPRSDGVRVEIEPFSAIDTRSGRFRRVTVTIANASIQGAKRGSPSLPIRNVRLEASDVVINPYRLIREGKIEVLSLREAAPSAEVTEEDANTYLASALRGGSARVRFSGGMISVEARPRRAPMIELLVKPKIVAGENIGFDVLRLRIGGVPLPASLAEGLAAGNNPILKPMPCLVRLDRLKVDGGVLALNE